MHGVIYVTRSTQRLHILYCSTLHIDKEVWSGKMRFFMMTYILQYRYIVEVYAYMHNAYQRWGWTVGPSSTSRVFY